MKIHSLWKYIENARPSHNHWVSSSLTASANKSTSSMTTGISKWFVSRFGPFRRRRDQDLARASRFDCGGRDLIETSSMTIEIKISLAFHSFFPWLNRITLSFCSLFPSLNQDLLVLLLNCLSWGGTLVFCCDFSWKVSVEQ